jgi:hypothetical protein
MTATYTVAGKSQTFEQVVSVVVRQFSRGA